MAVVLVARPWGLMGKPPAPAGHAAAGTPDSPCKRLRLAYGALLALLIAACCWASNGRTWPSC